MPNIVISHNGKVPHISQNYDRIARQRTPYAGDAMLRYDFSQATQSVDTPYYNTIGDAKYYSLTGSSFFERAYNFGTWSSCNIQRNSVTYNGGYIYDSTTNQYVMQYAGSTPSGGYALGTFSFNPSSYKDGSATIFSVFKTPTISPKNDKIFELISVTNSIVLSWNDTSAINKVNLTLSINGFLSGANCNFNSDTWCVAVATYSYAGTNSNTYIKANGQIGTGSIASNSGVGSEVISVMITATSSVTGFRIGEIIMYNGILTSQDISDVETYLKQKWNISY